MRGTDDAGLADADDGPPGRAARSTDPPPDVPTTGRALGGTVTAPDAPDGTLYLNAKSASLLNINIPAPLKSQAANVF